jgi:triacylglycerol esterase/lipase EstA (alpha/beta hydrolase family)
MLKDKEFKEFNIRYIFCSYETYVLISNYRHHNIPHKDLNEIARSVYFAMKHAKVGEKPFVLVCHSMGGLIGKTILNLAKENHDEKYLENAKGVVFFSTPHFGSDVVLRIFDSLAVNYQNIFKVFQTTANEYGFSKEDILHNLEKM